MLYTYIGYVYISVDMCVLLLCVYWLSSLQLSVCISETYTYEFSYNYLTTIKATHDRQSMLIHSTNCRGGGGGLNTGTDDTHRGAVVQSDGRCDSVLHARGALEVAPALQLAYKCHS